LMIWLIVPILPWRETIKQRKDSVIWFLCYITTVFEL
jgi:hypothetical protein